MTQEKSEYKKRSHKILGLSTKKLGAKLSNKSIPSFNLVNKGKNTVVVVTKTKSLKSHEKNNKSIVGQLTVEEKQNRLKANLNAEKTKILNFTENNCDNSQNKSENQHQIQHKKLKIGQQNLDNIKNLDDIGKGSLEKGNYVSPKIQNTNQNQLKTKNIANVKKKFQKLKNETIDSDDRKDNKRIKNIGLDKKEVKNLSLTKVYDLAREEGAIETQIKTIKAHSKARDKDSETIKQEKIYREVKIFNHISVQELATKMTEKKALVVKTLMTLGVNTTINQSIDADTAELVVQELGHKPIRILQEEIKQSLLNDTKDSPDKLKPRSPIITIMGHVDHGKTSLLDALRSTDVVKNEHGGITQHIGAYNVSLDRNRSITFLDTPGHAAFTAMRMRGAKITDIVVIVIAAEDGVKEQTIEAINHAKAAKVPIIVAINKIDKPQANVDKVQNSLLNHELIPEDMGGDTMVIPVSAKDKTGLNALEEAIMIQSEMLDLKANPDRKAEGVVIESKLDKSKGVLATFLVQKGTLRISDIVIVNDVYFKIKALINDEGKKIKDCMPSNPVEVLGLNHIPGAGEKFFVVENEKIAKKIVECNNYKNTKSVQNNVNITSFNDLLQNRRETQKILNIIIKADVHGSLEAIKLSLQKVSNDEVKVKISHSVVGSITESDVSLAKVTNSIILGFNVRADNNAIKAAKTLGVKIKYYSIIYNLIDDVHSFVSGLASPIKKENITGYAKIRNVINISKVGKIAGCIVTEGIIKKKLSARLIRNDIVVYDSKISTLRRFKEDVTEVKAGFECGISFEKFSDFKEDDTFEVYEIIEKAKN